VTVNASGVLGAASGVGNGLIVGADDDNNVALGSTGGAASTITPTVAATELSNSGILVADTAVLTVDDTSGAGAGIEANGTSTITVQSADGTTAKVVLTDVTLVANVNSGDDIVLIGGSIAITGAGVVKPGNAAEFSGEGTWTAGGSEETETITLGPVTDANTAQILGSDLTATLAADAATANITVTGNGVAKTLTVKKAILDLSGGGGLSLVGDDTYAGILTLFGTASTDLEVLYLGAGGSSLAAGNGGFTLVGLDSKEAVVTPTSGNNPATVLNFTGVDGGVLKSITPDGAASDVITGSVTANAAVTITNAATIKQKA
jgi:hypothetical protein